MDTDEMAVAMIVRQTGYDQETARSKLAEHDGDAIATIREYTRGAAGEALAADAVPNSVNQRIYGEIRSLMDAAGAEHRKMQAEKEKRERSLEVFKSQARLLAGITTLPPALHATSEHATASFSDCGLEFSNPTDLCFTLVEIGGGPGVVELDLPWLARTATDVGPATTMPNVRGSGGAGCVVTTTEDDDAVSWLLEARAIWPEAVIGVVAHPHGPPWAITPLGDRGLTGLEAGRVLRSRGDDGELQVCPDAAYAEAVKTLLEQEAAGADFAVTEPFYDVGTFLRFVRETRKAGSKLRLIPTLRIISSADDFYESAKERCIRVPPGVEATVARLRSGQDAHKLPEYGTALAITACKALLLRGVQHIHLEAADPEQAAAVVSRLGLGVGEQPSEQEPPSESSG